MAVGYVQAGANQEDQDNVSASWVYTPSVTLSAGNFGVLAFDNEDALAGATPTDNVGNTWTKLFDLLAVSACHMSLYGGYLTAAPTTITVPKNAAGNRPSAACLLELSAIASTSYLDVSATNNGTGTSCSTGTTATTAQADSMAIAVWTNDSLLAYSAQTNGFTEVVDFGSLAGGVGGVGVCLAYKVLSATGTVECTATRAAGAGVSWVAGVAVLKGSGGGGGGGAVQQTLTLTGAGS